MGQFCSALCGSNPCYVSIALKQPHGPYFGWMDNIMNQDVLKEEPDIHTWIQMVLGRHTWTNQLLYNDEEPTNIPIHSFPHHKGHTKGILLWNSEKIGWLVHSVPKYPEPLQLRKPFVVPIIAENQLLYGQSFCYVEMPIVSYHKILLAVYEMESSIYYTSLEPEHVTGRPNEQTVCENELYPNIFHLSKSSHWKKELYNDYLVERMGGKILAQTWMKPGLPSTKGVKNIKMLQLGDQEEYKTTQDHSKFCISMDARHPWVFIGDINRMESQTRRGGGGILIEDKNMWRALNRVIISYSEEDVENPNRVPTGCW